MVFINRYSTLFIVSLFFLCSVQIAFSQFPEAELPEYISVLHEPGERLDWSLDGKKVAFVTEEGGDLMEKNIETGVVRPLSDHYDLGINNIYYRVFYMADGNFLLTAGDDRYNAYMQILDSSLTKEPALMNVKVIEGPAPTRLTFPIRIAYCPEGQDKIRVATLTYGSDGAPVLENDHLVLDGKELPNDAVNYSGMIEPQNWRPPDEKELIFARYSCCPFLSETWGWNSETGELINYSNLPNNYAEPEGIFPDGEYTLIESDFDNNLGVSHLDLYRLKLDGSGDLLRLTNFADVENWKANNGVISPDGRYMAFQESQGGFGQGWGRIYLMDFEAAGITESIVGVNKVNENGTGNIAPSIRFSGSGVVVNGSNQGKSLDIQGREFRGVIARERF